MMRSGKILHGYATAVDNAYLDFLMCMPVRDRFIGPKKNKNQFSHALYIETSNTF